MVRRPSDSFGRSTLNIEHSRFLFWFGHSPWCRPPTPETRPPRTSPTWRGSTRIRIPREQPIAATPRYDRALRAVADLLTHLRVAFAFVGSVARAAYLGGRVEQQSIDVIAVMAPEQKNQLAMMASNRGFAVDREELEATDELDLVPIKFVDPEGDVRIHVLLATNALYGRMVADSVQAKVGEIDVKVPRIEDFAMLLQLSGDASALTQVVGSAGFDRSAYNKKVSAIGLRKMVIPE